MPVNDGVEEAAVTPAGGEIVAAQALVALHHALRPQQQLLLRRHVLRLPADLDVRDLPPGGQEAGTQPRGHPATPTPARLRAGAARPPVGVHGSHQAGGAEQRPWGPLTSGTCYTSAPRAQATPGGSCHSVSQSPGGHCRHTAGDLDRLTQEGLRHTPHPGVRGGWAQREQLLAQTPGPRKGCRSGGGGRSAPLAADWGQVPGAGILSWQPGPGMPGPRHQPGPALSCTLQPGLPASLAVSTAACLSLSVRPSVCLSACTPV